MTLKILVLNLGSTSTKVAYFEDTKEISNDTLRHSTSEVKMSLMDQIPFRLKSINEFLYDNDIDLEKLDCISARGGLLKPIDGGTYGINKLMIDELTRFTHGEHASNLSAVIAHELGKQHNIQTMITDPVVVDELIDEVRMTGLKDITRVSIFHALNQKAVARNFAKKIGRNYTDVNVIVVHMGGGITVGAHEKGRVIDVNDGLYGDGPMSPTRSGSLPNRAFAKYILDNQLNLDDISNIISKQSGLISLKGIEDALEIEQEALAGDQYSLDIYHSLSVQIAKEIGSRAAVLKGDIDGILFTGGLAYSQFLIDLITPYIEFIGDIEVYPGEEEMQALAEGAYRVLNGEERLKEYT